MRFGTAVFEIDPGEFIWGNEKGLQIGGYPLLVLHGSPEEMDRLAAAARRSAERQRSAPKGACDGSQFPESSDEYPIGSAPGVAA